MTNINAVRDRVKPYFHRLSGNCYVRLLDTPHIWGEPFDESIMTSSRARTKEFERAILEIVQKSRFRCDVASLNSPDPDWGRVILEAMDVALTEKVRRAKRTQFRFLFGQTPLYATSLPPNYVDFRNAIVRLIQSRRHLWEELPEIWMGRFYRLRKGITSALGSKLESAISFGLIAEDDEFTKMTWNHAKIIAVDGAEALVGGHNLNMDLFTSYPPVHDVSVVMHGDAAYGAQQFLSRMWECKTDLLTKEYLDLERLVWKNGDDDKSRDRRPVDPLKDDSAIEHMRECLAKLEQVHGPPRSASMGGDDLGSGASRERAKSRGEPPAVSLDEARKIRLEDLQTLEDLQVSESLLAESRRYETYDKLEDYRLATRVLSVGKYWKGENVATDYEKASELMKEELIKGARRILRLSQMDLVSAWKKKWSSHVVCHWIMEALLANEQLTVQVVVSPLDAGAGAEGDQYSFGSGACRTFDLMRYYMTHDAATDVMLPDAERRALALNRLHIAPFYYTDRGTDGLIEGQTYHWPHLPDKGFTATLKQPTLLQRRPCKGVIGSAVSAVIQAGGLKGKVPSAPGNHAKIMIVDDESYVVGSDNLYPGFLSEFNYVVEGEAAVNDLLEAYWHPLWWYSGRHCVNPACKGGCKAAGSKPSVPAKVGSSSGGRATVSPKSNDSGARTGSGQAGVCPLDVPGDELPLLHPGNAGRVRRILVGQPDDLVGILALDAEAQKRGATARRNQPEAPRPSDPSQSRASSASGVSSSNSSDSSGKSGAASSAKGKVPDADSNGDRIEGRHYYTDRQIFRLMSHYIGSLPNVTVLHGIDGYQLARLEPTAYDDAAPALPADGVPWTIVQPYNVRGNHWGLLYIRVDPSHDGGLSAARVLYIDPLNPHDVPNLSPLRRVFTDLSVERCTIRYQDDGELGQHSCGPWVVFLAAHLAAYNDVVPPADDDPLAAAVALRATHQQVIDGLGADF